MKVEETKTKSTLLPLHSSLQFFAGEPTDPPADLSADPPKGDPNDQQTNPPVDPPANPHEDPEGKGKKKEFTQDDVNAIAAKESKKAQEKLLKQLGVKDAKTAKDGLAQLQKILDAQKTDAEKALEKAKTLTTENQSLNTQVVDMQAKLAAMQADTDPKAVDDVVTLAKGKVSDDVTIEDAIKEVLTKYPQFKRTNEPPEDDPEGKGKKKPPKWSNGDHKNKGQQTEEEKWAAAFNFFGDQSAGK